MQLDRVKLQGRRRSDGRGSAAPDSETGLLGGVAIPIIAIGFVAIFAPLRNYSDSLMGSPIDSGSHS